MTHTKLTAHIARGWIPLTVVSVATLGGIGVYRLHAMFDTTTFFSNPTIAPFFQFTL